MYIWGMQPQFCYIPKYQGTGILRWVPLSCFPLSLQITKLEFPL